MRIKGLEPAGRRVRKYLTSHLSVCGKRGRAHSKAALFFAVEDWARKSFSLSTCSCINHTHTEMERPTVHPRALYYSNTSLSSSPTIIIRPVNANDDNNNKNDSSNSPYGNQGKYDDPTSPTYSPTSPSSSTSPPSGDPRAQFNLSSSSSSLPASSYCCYSPTSPSASPTSSYPAYIPLLLCNHPTATTSPPPHPRRPLLPPIPPPNWDSPPPAVLSPQQQQSPTNQKNTRMKKRLRWERTLTEECEDAMESVHDSSTTTTDTTTTSSSPAPQSREKNKRYRAMRLIAKVLLHIANGTEHTSAGMHSVEMMREILGVDDVL